MTKLEDMKQCPECGKSWVGKEISRENRKHYGGKTNFSLLVGIETQNYDGIGFWMCPFCKTRWNGFTGEKVIEKWKQYLNTL